MFVAAGKFMVNGPMEPKFNGDAETEQLGDSVTLTVNGVKCGTHDARIATLVPRLLTWAMGEVGIIAGERSAPAPPGKNGDGSARDGFRVR